MAGAETMRRMAAAAGGVTYGAATYIGEGGEPEPLRFLDSGAYMARPCVIYTHWGNILIKLYKIRSTTFLVLA